jgi:hypothetical protein
LTELDEGVEEDETLPDNDEDVEEEEGAALTTRP